ARISGLTDKGGLTLGASSAASDGLDAFDDPHPPALPSRFLDLYTQHSQSDPGWQAQALATLRYRADYATPLNGAARSLPFLLETDQSGSATLSWSISPDLDLAQHQLTLKDLDAGASVDMWLSSSYAVPAAPGVHHLRIEMTPGRQAPPLAYDQSLTTDENA